MGLQKKKIDIPPPACTDYGELALKVSGLAEGSLILNLGYVMIIINHLNYNCAICNRSWKNQNKKKLEKRE